MDMPFNAQVECLDGVCGQSSCLIVNPSTCFISHVVVQDNADPDAYYLVPFEEIKLAFPHLIQLRCTYYELQQMPRFVHITHEHRMKPYTFYPPGSSIGPTMIWENDLVPIAHELVPEGEVAVHAKAQVEAHDGPLGQVDEFLLDPSTEQIDYLVLRERHLWHDRELIVPASQIDLFASDTIYLKSDKQVIEQLQADARSKMK